MPRTRKYTDADRLEAIKTSYSYRQVLLKLGLKGAGGNYKHIKEFIIKNNIDISHFTHQGHLKGKTHNWAVKIPIEEILVENSTYANINKLRKRLLKEGYFEKVCNACGNTKWKNKFTKWKEEDIPLELEHKNGISNDHRIENLEIICPNCHAFTETYRGRNIKKKNK